MLVAYSGGVDSTLLAVQRPRRSRPAVQGRPRHLGHVPDVRGRGRREHSRGSSASTSSRSRPTSWPTRASPPTRPTAATTASPSSSRCSRTSPRCTGWSTWPTAPTPTTSRDFRPGARAAAESGVVSPLQDVGMTKADIRGIARELGLPNWDKPSMACLASRFPYGQPITDSALDARGPRRDRASATWGCRSSGSAPTATSPASRSSPRRWSAPGRCATQIAEAVRERRLRVGRAGPRRLPHRAR